MDHYRVLGVAPDATKEQIRKAYRELALQCHPDKISVDAGSDDLFKQISEAYRILMDEESRMQYDRELAHRAVEIPIFTSDLFDSVFEDFWQDCHHRSMSMFIPLRSTRRRSLFDDFWDNSFFPRHQHFSFWSVKRFRRF